MSPSAPNLVFECETYMMHRYYRLLGPTEISEHIFCKTNIPESQLTGNDLANDYYYILSVIYTASNDFTNLI